MKYVTQHPIKKSDLGFHGNLFGGKLLAWLDAAAASYASEYCDTPRMVTRAIDKCVFNKPAREGQLLKIFAMFEEKIFWKEGFEGKCMGGMMFRSFDLNKFLSKVEIDNGLEVVALKFDGNNIEVITSAEKK